MGKKVLTVGIEIGYNCAPLLEAGGQSGSLGAAKKSLKKEIDLAVLVGYKHRPLAGTGCLKER